MPYQVSINTRFLLWRRGIPREQWQPWLESRTGLGAEATRDLIRGRLADERVGEAALQELARAFEHADAGESLLYSDLPRDSGGVLSENLRHLFGSLDHGGKKLAATELGIDPTTISRWLAGKSEPQSPSLQRLASYFGIPAGTDLRTEPVFLSLQPVSLTELKRWLHARIEELGTDEFRQLLPALRRMLGDP
jgi:transcriptional regulator with XRE-family HTH domain